MARSAFFILFLKEIPPMSKTLYVSADEAKTGKSAIVLGVMHTLQRELGNVAFFRPIINEPEDHDLRLILTRF